MSNRADSCHGLACARHPDRLGSSAVDRRASSGEGVAAGVVATGQRYRGRIPATCESL